MFLYIKISIKTNDIHTLDGNTYIKNYWQGKNFAQYFYFDLKGG
jgi:hypothetical protein